MDFDFVIGNPFITAFSLKYILFLMYGFDFKSISKGF